ncbi:WD repeat-containing protein 48-like isoform X2 [Convolutriloba macropyga]|uniref:WD repeat-containing protein 48-like isoform X2 n=1 Tax=Convolutriloba macropyga TaxID=536237 RepID=UPI003F52713F
MRMSAYHRPGNQRQRRTITVIIRNDANDVKYHHNGVNALQYDPHEKKLYSAGRDSVIRGWNVSSSALAKHQLSTQPMEHHCDWVNDIVLCMNGKNIVSASSDCTVKVWNVSRGFCMSTLRTHKDYVKCLAYARDRELVASAGFDRQIFLWDVGKLLQLTATNNTINTQNLLGATDSIYSLSMNPTGTVCVAGTSEKSLLVWDPRTQNFNYKMKGHTNIVKSLVVSPDGTKVLSGSSDGLIKLWCLGEQRCIETFKIHQDSVWCLLTDTAFTTLYSGGRDGCVFETDLTPSLNTLNDNCSADSSSIFASRQVVQEKKPVISMQFGDHSLKSLWIATTSSHINKWEIPPESSTQGGRDDDAFEQQQQNDYESIYSGGNGSSTLDNHTQSEHYPTAVLKSATPLYTIEGKPALVRYHVLNNKRHVLTQDSEGTVSKWDVLTGVKESVIGQVASFDDELKRHFQFIFVPSWFSVDLKTGYLCVHIDEMDCLQAWVPYKELNMRQRYGGDMPDSDKVHFACLLLQALFERWPESGAMKYTLELAEQENAARQQQQFSSPSHLRDALQQSPEDVHGMNKQAESGGGSRARRGSSGSGSDSYLASPGGGLGVGGGAPLKYLGNNYFSLPDHTVFIINEMPSGKAISRYLTASCERDVESQQLKDTLPEWIKEIVVEMIAPKFHKLAFFLLPHPNCNLKVYNNKKDRLSANDLLPVRKILEHVVEKILKPESTSSSQHDQYGGGATSANSSGGGTNSTSGGNHPSGNTHGGMTVEELNDAVDAIELICNDVVLELSWDLRTIKHFIWRGVSGDLTLFFKQKETSSSSHRK